MTQEQRLRAIIRATNELNVCVACRDVPNFPEPMGATLGECDWLGELHKLLYDEVDDGQRDTSGRDPLRAQERVPQLR